MLNQKELLILDYLQNNSGSYITSKTIACHLNVTDKTARKYIKQLAQAIDPKTATIESIPGHGFKLLILDPEEFRKFFQNSQSSLFEKTDIMHIEASKDRQYFILREILFEDRQVSFDDVMTELAVSQSTLLNDIQDINKRLKPYTISLKTSKKQGLSIVGEEHNKRHFIMNYFFVERVQNNLRSLGEISKLLNTISSEEILLIVLDECRNAHLKLNDTVILNIVTHIALALKRVEEGYQINFDHLIDKDEYATEFKAAGNIVNRLKKSSDIALPEEEVNNIALHLKNKSSKSAMMSLDKETQHLKEEIQSVLADMDSNTGSNLANDTIAINGLVDHFSPFLDRLSNNNKLSNPILNEIVTNYTSEFELTKVYFSKMPQLVRFDVSDDEWAYISLHIIAALERNITVSKVKTLVVCATGLGSSQMLKVRLENELGSKLEIINVISYYEIKEEALKDIDLIVSSIDLSNVVFNIPVVNVSILLNQEDVRLINETIGLRLSDRHFISKVSDSNKTTSILLNKYFHSDLFLVSETIETKEEALNVLIDKCISRDESISKQYLMGQLKLRDSFSSVVFSEDIAVPHPIEGIGEQSTVAVLITPNGLDWDVNGSHIKLTVLMIPDKYGNSGLEDVSKAILPIIERKDYLEELIKVKTFSEFQTKLVSLLG